MSDEVGHLLEDLLEESMGRNPTRNISKVER